MPRTVMGFPVELSQESPKDKIVIHPDVAAAFEKLVQNVSHIRVRPPERESFEEVIGRPLCS